MNGNDTPSISSNVAEQAMRWHFELQEPDVSPSTLAAWLSWRQAHPGHEQAWQRAQVFAQRMTDIRSPSQQHLAQATLRPTLSRRGALKQLGVLLAAGAGAWHLKDAEFAQDWSADYYSHIGEQRRITLPGDTHVQLNTDSAISTVFDRETQRINLLRGELLISRNKPGDNRLLSVGTEQGHVQAAAARFSLRQRSGFTQVSVYQGALAVTPSGQAHTPISLKAGEQLHFGSQGLLSRHTVAFNDPAWSQGMLVAQGQRLAEFLEDLSRYRRGHLACDPDLNALRVSGTFPLADPEKIIFAIADTLQLNVQQFTRYWVTLKPRVA